MSAESLWVSTYVSGFEEGAVFPTIPRGLPAPGCVCLHGGYAALYAGVNRHLPCSLQVRTSFR